MGDRIRDTSILCCALVCEINFALCVKSYVLKKSVALDSGVDVWLRLFVEIDYLCIAATFEVEHTVVVPSVLIVADKMALWVG